MLRDALSFVWCLVSCLPLWWTCLQSLFMGHWLENWVTKARKTKKSIRAWFANSRHVSLSGFMEWWPCAHDNLVKTFQCLRYIFTIWCFTNFICIYVLLLMGPLCKIYICIYLFIYLFVYYWIVQKELGDRRSASIDFVRQLLPLPKMFCEVMMSEYVHSGSSDTRGGGSQHKANNDTDQHKQVSIIHYLLPGFCLFITLFIPSF